MSNYKYSFEINLELYSKYEENRKKYQHYDMNRTDVIEIFKDIGIPIHSPIMWQLCRKYHLLEKKGKARYTSYYFPKESPAYSRFEELEKEYYNGKPAPEKKQIKEKESGRVPLTEEYMIEALKKTGKYLIFQVNPNFEKLKSILNLHLLIDNSEVIIR